MPGFRPKSVGLSRARMVHMHVLLVDMLPATPREEALLYFDEEDLALLEHSGFYLCRGTGRGAWFYGAPTAREEDVLEAICSMVFVSPLNEHHRAYGELIESRARLIELYAALV